MTARLNVNQLNEMFKSLLGSEKVSLYRYQEKVAEHLLLSNKNVILRAPTGAGKTWAALLPYLYAHKFRLPFVDKVLYALPLRSLASQLFSSTVEEYNRLKAEEKYNGDKLSITIQTGNQQDDPFFQGDIVFTTIDQLLSSYILSPVSLSSRLANINAGAMLGGLIVFDEFHLLDPNRSMGTAIEMLNRLNGFCRFLLMTATLSDEAVSRLERILSNVVVIDLGDDEIEAIEGRKYEPTKRLWKYKDKTITVEDILRQHRKRTLVMTNSVSRAQQIYGQTKELLDQRKFGAEITLLHSRFFPRDRNRKENLIIERLGKERQYQPANFILISTQVVEAGMDISVDTLHSELAPINSLIQRAGRCARYGGEGVVNIYWVENDKPYDAGMRETEAFLAGKTEELFSYTKERDAVNQILGEYEKAVLLQYSNFSRRRARVDLAMDGILPGARDELIRDINSINVLLTSAPEEVRFDRPGSSPEMLSVPAETLRSFLFKATAAAGEQWVAKVPVTDDAEGDETQIFCFRWQKLEPKLLTMTWLVALNPAFVHYSSDMGLLLGEAGRAVPITYKERGSPERYRYRCEIYGDHVHLVLQQYEQIKERSRRAAAMLADKLMVTVEEIENAVVLALLFHDIGKLSTGWQDVAKKWQKYKTPNELLQEPLAHTDFNPDEDWETQRKFARRPPHAVEGAYAVCNYLSGIFTGKEEIASCIFTAIARHHSGQAAKLSHFSLIPAAVEEVNNLLQRAALPPVNRLLDKPDHLSCGAQGEFADVLLKATREGDYPWLPLYFFIVRQLRLADQAGSAKGGRQ